MCKAVSYYEIVSEIKPLFFSNFSFLACSTRFKADQNLSWLRKPLQTRKKMIAVLSSSLSRRHKLLGVLDSAVLNSAIWIVRRVFFNFISWSRKRGFFKEEKYYFKDFHQAKNLYFNYFCIWMKQNIGKGNKINIWKCLAVFTNLCLPSLCSIRSCSTVCISDKNV